uniref:Uncharacterized protein n=1 Tax=Timema douglasi TaxID=61478 RepID=A0A7R8ZG69_TIMDO|nr:unnamed protein product [Timema douglasi]
MVNLAMRNRSAVQYVQVLRALLTHQPSGQLANQPINCVVRSLVIRTKTYFFPQVGWLVGTEHQIANFPTSSLSTSCRVCSIVGPTWYQSVTALQAFRYKPRVQSSSVDSSSSSSSLYKFKLNRPGGNAGRWQYKTTAKPRISIRKQPEDGLDNATLASPSIQQPNIIEARSRSDDNDQGLPMSPVDVELMSSEPERGQDKDVDALPVVAETIKVEISTPADFKDIYYEIATIKSPYTFQVGTVKNTRYITVTSTIEKSLEPDSTSSEPLTENLLASTTAPIYAKESTLPLDSSIATLPPIALAGDVETPPLETLTESFSTTQLQLKTHILPVVRGGSNTTRQVGPLSHFTGYNLYQRVCLNL